MEIMKGDELGRPGGSSHEQPSREIMKEASYETRRQRQPRAAQKGNHEERQAWETKLLRRAIMKGDKLGRQGGKQQSSMKRDKLGRQGGSGSQEQPRRAIMKGDKLGRQGGSQEQPGMEIMKRDKLGRQGGKQQPRAGSGSQEQPRMEITKGDNLGR